MIRSITRASGWTTLVAAGLFLLLMPVAGFAAHHEKDTTSATEVKREAMQTYDALKRYTIEQRNEAMAKAKEQLAELDARIAQMRQDVERNWSAMSRKTQKQTRETLQALEQKRQDLAEWYGGLRYSSREAWEDVKKGFAESYQRLEDAFHQAQKDFTSDKQ
ncbi:MAG: hypothetical protein P8Y91_10055 [Desulfuromonadales bacterium]|jgi:TolA-binding protein